MVYLFYKSSMNKEEAKKLVINALTAGRQALLEPEAKALVSAWGIQVPKSVLIEGLADVAIKSKQASIALKELKKNLAEKAPKARIAGFLLEETLPTGIELIIGGLRDPQFGPAVMFGTGGIAVELVKDVSFRLAPLNREEVFDMMREVKSYPLLTGFRGSKPVEIEKLASAIMKLSDILLEIEEIKEIEINPLLVYEEGAVAVDARVVLQ